MVFITFFICDKLKEAQLFSGKVREKICNDLNLLNKNSFEFCWIVDFPMYEIDEDPVNANESVVFEKPIIDRWINMELRLP